MIKNFLSILLFLFFLSSFFQSINKFFTKRMLFAINVANVFSHIYGETTHQLNRKTISVFLKQTYLSYFDMKLGEDKSWAPTVQYA